MVVLKLAKQAPSLWVPTGFSTQPSVPTSVTATPGDTTALLAWSPPASDGGAAIVGYRVGRDGVDNTGYGAWETTLAATARSITFAKLVNGTTYNVYVEAISSQYDPGVRATREVTPAGPPPPSSSAARQLGVYVGGFPSSGNGGFTAFEDQLLGGETVLCSLTFANANWNTIKSGGGIYPAWKAWLDQGGRRMIHSVGLVPHFGPDGNWSTKKGTDAQVAAALQAGAAGDYDAHWTTMGQNLASAGLNRASTVIRLAWEHNGNWYSFRSGVDPEAFKAYFRRAVDRIRAGANLVQIDLTAAGNVGWFLRNGAGQQVGAYDDAYPGDAYVDILGVDMYDNRGTTPSVEGWATKTGPRLQQHLNFAEERGKPLGIGEWGVIGSTTNSVEPDNPYYVEKMHETIQANNVLYAVYFNASPADGDHRITTPTAFPNAAAKFASLAWNLATP